MDGRLVVEISGWYKCAITSTSLISYFLGLMQDEECVGVVNPLMFLIVHFFTLIVIVTDYNFMSLSLLAVLEMKNIIDMAD